MTMMAMAMVTFCVLLSSFIDGITYGNLRTVFADTYHIAFDCVLTVITFDDVVNPDLSTESVT